MEIPEGGANKKEAQNMYEILFPDDGTKARMFNRFAEEFFLNNFGSMSKADFELLLFSLYLGRMMEMWPDQPERYSDYRLSKLLGITEGRIRSLKERKELKYPSRFEWEKAFARACEKAEFENGKVRLFIRDARLYSELCNRVMDMGSYSETTMTRQLFVVTPPVFVDLMVAASDQDTQSDMRACLQHILEENHLDVDKYVQREKTWREIVHEAGDELGKQILLSALDQIPLAGSALAKSAEKILNDIKTNKKKEK